MARNVWHKRYHGDAINGYMGLTLEQRGAYTTLLDLMYDSEWAVGIPDQDRWIAGHLNVSVRRWRALRQDLIGAGKIDIIDGMISNKRYRIERENSASLSRKRAENGASGGEKSGEVRRKAAENRRSGEANASVLPLYACATETDTDTEVNNKGGTTSTPVERERERENAPRGADDDRGLQVHWDVIELAEHIARVAGVRHLEPGKISANVQAVREWLDAGADPPMIAQAVQSGRASASKGIYSLNYFDARVRKAIANRDHPDEQSRHPTTEIRDPLLRRYLENGGSLAH